MIIPKNTINLRPKPQVTVSNASEKVHTVTCTKVNSPPDEWIKCDNGVKKMNDTECFTINKELKRWFEYSPKLFCDVARALL